MIEIRNYCLELEDIHYTFASRMFKNRRKRRNAEYLYWLFKGEIGKPLTNFKLAIENGKVIGQFGVIPCKLKFGSISFDAQWACHLMIDQAHRGKGVATMLYNAAHEEREITLGSNPSPAAEKSMTKNGYRKLKSSERYFIPIYLGVPFRIKGYPINILNKIRNPFLSFYREKEVSERFEEMNICNMHHEDIFVRDTDDRVSISIDNGFKEWRFKAFKDYYPGIKAYRLKDKRTFFTGYINGVTFFITDFILQDRDDFKSIISYILDIIKETNVEIIRFYKNDLNWRMHQYRTIMFKYSRANSIIYFTDNYKIKNLLNEKSFYYTYQDSDENL